MPKRRGRGEGTVTQRGPKVWRLRAYAGSDPATGTPRQVSRTVEAANITEARKKLREFLDDLDAGRVDKTGTKATVRQLLDAYLDHLRRVGREQTTLETYRTIIDKHLIPRLGTVELRRLGPFDIDSYYRQLEDAGLAARYIRTHHAILSGALTQAVRWGWVRANPAAAATPPAKPKATKQIPEVDQVRALVDAAGDDIDLATAVVLAAILGGRRGELAGLRWPDIDWTQGVARLARQRVPVKGGEITKTLKNAKGDDEVRPVALGPLGIAVLERYRQAVADRAGRLEVAPDWDGWLLSYDCGRTPMRAKGLGEAITALGKRAGVPVTTHSFRRFAATQMVGAGVDVVTAAARLGHTPDMLLRVYAGFIPSRDQDAARGLETLVLGPAEKIAPSGTSTVVHSPRRGG